MSKYSRRDDFGFEIKSHLGVLSTSSTGWQKELNLVSWNGRKEKFDIREWDPQHTNMSRGVTLTRPEFDELVRILSSGAQTEAEMDCNLFAVEQEADTLQTAAIPA